MNRIGLTLGMILFLIFGLNAQDIKEIDGLYYENNELYSGSYCTLHDNGQVKMEMKVKEGKKHGKVKIYFENGRLNEIRSYKNNRMHGKWEMYNEKENQVKIKLEN